MLNILKSLYIVCLLLTVLMFSCKSPQKSSNHSSRPSGKTSAKTKEHPENSATAGDIVKTARSYIGTRYQHAGTTKAGMDCSGLVFTTFKTKNITLPRSSEEMSKVGQKVSLNDLRPGDLVFFTDKKGRSQVTHVGLVSEIRGPRDVKFVHSSTKLGVVESDLYVDYYFNIFLFAKRVIEE
jgi:probable lipoprotein NlpC